MRIIFVVCLLVAVGVTLGQQDVGNLNSWRDKIMADWKWLGQAFPGIQADPNAQAAAQPNPANPANAAGAGNPTAQTTTDTAPAASTATAPTTATAAAPPTGPEVVSLAQLQCIYKNCAASKLQTYLGPLNSALNTGDIKTPKRIQAFLAQVGHESGEFRYWEELASGSAYNGRRDLGNTQPGDGPRFKGRGPIQITGRTNYEKCGNYLHMDFTSGDNMKKLATDPFIGFSCAIWFWNDRGLSRLADAGDFRSITRRINGGFNGMPDRLRLYNLAKQCIPG